MRVLVVDDDPIGLDSRRMVLEMCGHSVTVAADADGARAGFAASPEAVVLDLRLPLIEDALALLRELHETAPGTRVVVLSGYLKDLDGRPERAFADAILEKPVRSERLLEALSRPAGGAFKK